ncbi:carbohydrate ABC transporter permease [Paenibacillus qinlingensis]|uniref:Aldouronate transport system permease protein n=1 Tax=Paenibacillus qinlingensis TaxID=1837343 RepID=A0ABU1NWK2_9BACL|nr:carbohydrate ABC transporter permease [Paenibacillus qinlingensis]MDR6551846.1 putative aldouronate transport system permease protein [Paenibacillus qinlingensis]
MLESPSWSRKVFVISNYTVLLGLSILCILPLIHLLSLSLSSNNAVAAGDVRFWPVDFTWKSYDFILSKPAFLTSLFVTLKRVALGVTLNMVLTIMVAYPLSKESAALKGRTVYVWLFVFTMLFSGGIIPLYMTIRSLGLLDSIWALVLHNAVPVFNVVILLNFFRSLPKELEEAALMDGAGHWRILWRIYVPLSTPSLATLTLFAIVSHWNSWFDGILFMNSPTHYPLQSYLYTVVVGLDSLVKSNIDLEVIALVSDRTARAAQIFLGALPILIVYPFLQRYFTKGIVLGSVKE